MALDIYCGTLCRYYAGDWQSVVQQWAEANGIDYVVNRKRTEGTDVPDMTDEEAREAILKWKDGLRHFLAEEQQLTFDWCEDADAPYRSDRPDWSAYWLVLLWALYQEQGAEPFDELPAGFELDKDPVFAARNIKGYESQYPMLNSEVDLFLPIPQPVQINGADPFGQPVGIASSTVLWDELKALNANTWQADDAEIASWRETYNRVLPRLEGEQLIIDKAQSVDRFEEVAKYGFSILYDLTRFAVEHQLPLRLDW